MSASADAGRARLRLRLPNITDGMMRESGAAVKPVQVGALLPSLLRVPNQPLSTSNGARELLEVPAPAAAARTAEVVAPRVSVSLPSGAADASSILELKGASTVRNTAESAGKGEQMRNRVRIPSAAAAVDSATLTAYNMASKFTVDGAIHPVGASQFFHIRPDTSALMEHFDARQFFFLCGPLGAGKTTTALHALAAARDRGWYGLHIKLGGLALSLAPAPEDDHDGVGNFWRELGTRVSMAADEWGLKLQPINSAATFQGAFSRSVLGSSKVILLFDDFDALSTAAPRAKASVSSVSGLNLCFPSRCNLQVAALGCFSTCFSTWQGTQP